MKELKPPTPQEIRDMRNSIDLTQEQAGNLLQVSTRHFQRWEQGLAIMHLAYWELFTVKIRVLKNRKDARPMA